MMSLVKDFLRLLWRRDSESAALLCIAIAEFLTDKDLRQMADYFHALRDYNRRFP